MKKKVWNYDDNWGNPWKTTTTFWSFWTSALKVGINQFWCWSKGAPADPAKSLLSSFICMVCLKIEYPFWSFWGIPRHWRSYAIVPYMIFAGSSHHHSGMLIMGMWTPIFSGGMTIPRIMGKIDINQLDHGTHYIPFIFYSYPIHIPFIFRSCPVFIFHSIDPSIPIPFIFGDIPPTFPCFKPPMAFSNGPVPGDPRKSQKLLGGRRPWCCSLVYPRWTSSLGQHFLDHDGPWLVVRVHIVHMYNMKNLENYYANQWMSGAI